MYEDLPLFIKYSARKIIVSKFKFIILKLWEFPRLFAAMACVNLVFPPQKVNSDLTRHKGPNLIRPSLIEFLKLLLCDLRYNCPNWTDLKRLTESVYLLQNWN